MEGVTNKNSIPENLRRMGIYEYAGRYYTNKFRALKAAGTDHVNYDFNNEQFSRVDWTVEPDEDLYALYAERAWQIRSQYEKVIIYYSGGIDSTVVLRSFVDNNIPVDAVIINGIFDTNTNYKDTNVAEQIRVAMPYLEELQKEKNIKLPIYWYDTLKAHKLAFNDPDWQWKTVSQLCPATIANHQFHSDPYIQTLMSKGNTIAVKGIDKPRIIYEDDKWYWAFLDVSIGGCVQREEEEFLGNYILEEFFYWAPEADALLRKQAHMVIRELEKRFTKEECAKKFSKTGDPSKAIYGALIEPIVFGKYLKQEIGQTRPYFYVPSGFASVMNPKQWWFFNAKDVLTTENELFIRGVLDIKNSIDPMHFNKAGSDKNKKDFWLNNCPLDERLVMDLDGPNPLFGTVGSWGPLYYIKDYDDSNNLT